MAPIVCAKERHERHGTINYERISRFLSRGLVVLLWLNLSSSWLPRSHINRIIQFYSVLTLSRKLVEKVIKNRNHNQHDDDEAPLDLSAGALGGYPRVSTTSLISEKSCCDRILFGGVTTSKACVSSPIITDYTARSFQYQQQQQQRQIPHSNSHERHGRRTSRFGQRASRRL